MAFQEWLQIICLVYRVKFVNLNRPLKYLHRAVLQKCHAKIQIAATAICLYLPELNNFVNERAQLNKSTE